MSGQKKLYIPSNISLRKEIWQGFGYKELVITIIVSSVALIILLVLLAMSVIELFWLMAIFFGIVAFTAVFLQKVDNNLSAIDYIVITIDFNKKQQKFVYKEVQNVFEDTKS